MVIWVKIWWIHIQNLNAWKIRLKIVLSSNPKRMFCEPDQSLPAWFYLILYITAYRSLPREATSSPHKYGTPNYTEPATRCNLSHQVTVTLQRQWTDRAGYPELMHNKHFLMRKWWHLLNKECSIVMSHHNYKKLVTLYVLYMFFMECHQINFIVTDQYYAYCDIEKQLWCHNI